MNKLATKLVLSFSLLLGCARPRPVVPQARPLLRLTTFGKTHIQLLRPQTIRLVGLLDSERDLSAFACAGIEWDIPGEQRSLNQALMNCDQLQVYFFREVHLRSYGIHRCRLTLISAWTRKVLASAEVVIEIGPSPAL